MSTLQHHVCNRAHNHTITRPLYPAGYSTLLRRGCNLYSQDTRARARPLHLMYLPSEKYHNLKSACRRAASTCTRPHKLTSILPPHTHPGAGVRRDLYQLYHYLNHLVLFGDSYYSNCTRTMERLVSHIK